MLLEAREQPWNVRWSVFTVTIHDDYGISRSVAFDECQCDRNCALVTDVTTQREHFYTIQGAPVVSGPVRRYAFRRPVVNQQEVGGQARIRQHSVQAWKEKAGCCPIVINRYQDEQFVSHRVLGHLSAVGY